MVAFHLLNFGCRASQADGAALKQQLLQAGLEEAASVEQSHVAVLNTCTVTAAADAEVRQVVRRIHRRNPGCRILVTGCYAQRAPQEIAELAGVAWVVGNSHRHLITEVLASSMEFGIPGRESPVKGPPDLVQISAKSPAPGLMSRAMTTLQTPDSGLATPDSPQVLVGEIAEKFHFSPVFPDDRTRPTLKVQDGCNARCSFCIIPEVRGRSRSLAPHTVIEQVRELVANGYQEIVLSGINLGRYGRDLNPHGTFLGLLERILAETSLPRLRISSIETMDVTAELVRLVAHTPRLAQHFHVPLQSGCDRILRLMNRRYWAAQYAERLLAIREQIPNCGIGADVMVGFPGETDHDHTISARFIESLPFTYLHIFPYSARPGTPAATRPGQVNGRVARERSQEIRSLLVPKRQAFLAAQVGQSISALTLDEADEGARIALTTNYLRVALPGSALQPNRLADVWIGRAQGGLLYGYPAR
jgi:threonylcarbamoyladenosine tRNA methylthiotransferase MtaB